MRCVQVFKATFVAAFAALLTCASTGYAGSFHFEIDTSALGSLPASAGAPFSLDLQFVDGGVLGNNTVQVSNFTYGGGTATGSATTAGGAAGDIGSTVTFDNSTFFQELYQSFTPGTKLAFDVNLSQNVDGLTPDSFVVAILDKDLLNIPTTGTGNSLVQIDINQATGTLVVNVGSGTGDYVSVNVVPEPTSLTIAGIGIGAIVGYGWRRRKSTGA